MKKISILLGVSLLVLLLAGCKKERTRQEKVSAIINNVDAPFFIATLTPQNLIDKSGATEGVLPWTYETLFGFFMLEEETGIDNNEQVQLVAGKGSGIGPDMYGIFKVKNQKKFSIMLEKELNAEIKEKEGIKYITKDKDNYVMVWNDEFAIAANIPINLASLFGGGDESKKTVNRCIKLINETEEGEINTEYVEFLGKEADIATYFDTEGLMKFLTGMDLVAKDEIAEYKESYEGNKFESYLNFEDGSVSWEHKVFLSEFLLEKINFVPEKGISESLFSFGNTSEPLLKYSFNLNPSLLLDYMKDQMKDETYKEFEDSLAVKGFSIEDIKNTFSGEVLMMLDGFTIEKEIVDYGYGEPFEVVNSLPVMGIVIGVKDKAVFTKLAENADESPVGLMNLGEGMFGVLTGDVFFISNDTAWINKVVNNNSASVNSEDGKLKEQPVALYASFDKTNPNSEAIYKEKFPIAEIFENIWGYANLTEAEVNIILKDKSQNSLRVITKYISDYMAEEEMKANQDMKDILDEEVLESLEEGVEKIGEAFEEADIEGMVEDIFNEVGK